MIIGELRECWMSYTCTEVQCFNVLCGCGYVMCGCGYVLCGCGYVMCGCGYVGVVM